MDTDFVDAALTRGREVGPIWLGAVVSLALFLFAVQLLGTATNAAAAPLEGLFRRYVAGDGTALGVSWLATYALTNGSVVAALSVSLFDAGILTATQLFLMVAGSRLGAAAIVVLIGTLDYLQKRRYSLGKATSLGLLTFLLTHSVYLPATVLGYLLLPWLRDPLRGVGAGFDLSVRPLAVFDPATNAVVDAAGVWVGLGVAVLFLFASLALFDRVLGRVDTDWLRERFFHRFQRKWTAFGLGLLVTGVTTSVAFSLGVIVPLYNREYVKRREIMPYILGANIGTFFDTVAIGVLLDSPRGVAVVLSLVVVGALLTLGALLEFAAYATVVDVTQDRLLDDRRSLAVFLISLVVVPLVLVLLPF